ncbi:hypothetical protein C2845_PM01G41990 [Panicum miliaceum]|uniref:Cytochrome b561 domain-containing protein n=1 Tax=Panicum miliaceum TaxID=4540 RepID=A0A3L6TGV6_PANMI|nr:hypothetical protein C2845_PM01G41990 [Panicum miliaceum]
MLLGSIILGGKAILCYRSLSLARDARKKAHLALHAAGLAAGAIGVYTVFKFHAESGIPNLYLLHSWRVNAGSGRRRHQRLRRCSRILVGAALDELRGQRHGASRGRRRPVKTVAGRHACGCRGTFRRVLYGMGATSNGIGPPAATNCGGDYSCCCWESGGEAGWYRHGRTAAQASRPLEAGVGEVLSRC